MKVSIKTTVRTEKIVEVEVPYYFEADHGGDDYYSVSYGRVDVDRAVVLKKCGSYRCDSVTEWEIETTIGKHVPQRFAGYAEQEHASTERDFEAARREFLEVVRSGLGTI